MDDDIVTISEIEHFSFCDRQWALISREHIWGDNVATMRGTLAHERVDIVSERSERGRSVLRALDIWSDRYSLLGRADVVEIHAEGAPYPIEYKSGRLAGPPAKLQLAAQALCLEEMFDQAVPEGAIWLGGTRKRVPVVIDDALRERVLATAGAIRTARENQHLPPAIHDRRCQQCSLQDECLPQLVQDRQRVETANDMLFTKSSD